jgi:hypothetical protein
MKEIALHGGDLTLLEEAYAEPGMMQDYNNNYERLAKHAKKIYEFANYISNSAFKWEKGREFYARELLAAAFIMMIHRRILCRTKGCEKFLRSVRDEGCTRLDLVRFEIVCKELFKVEDAGQKAKVEALVDTGYSRDDAEEEIYNDSV